MLVQLVSAILALRMIKMTNHSKAWIIISIALFLMAFRRLIMAEISSMPDNYNLLLIMEAVGVVISLLMLFGMIFIKSLFEKINEYAANQKVLTDILDNTSDFVSTIDRNLKTVYLNNSGKKMLFENADIDISGIEISRIHDKKSYETIRDEALPISSRDGNWRGETVFVKSNGTTVDISQVVIAHFNEHNEITYYSTIARDITQRKLKEKRLIELNASKDKFFSIISHDLRSPIGAVKTAVGFLIKEYDTLGKEEILEMLESIEKSISNDYDLLENLLQWSRLQIGSNALNISKADLNFIVDNTIELLDPITAKKSISIENRCDKEIFLAADVNIIRLTLRNLLSNAIKFSYPNSYIIVECEQRANDVLIKVIDSGVGISEDNLSKIFDTDKNVTTIGTASEVGTGLGLNLCREFVRRHSFDKLLCDIYIKSELGKGTEISFNLPKSLDTL